jgi:hypothetical protein
MSKNKDYSWLWDVLIVLLLILLLGIACWYTANFDRAVQIVPLVN